MEKDKEQIDSCPVQHYDRREFINLAWWGTAGLLALTGISATVASLWPRPKAGPFGRKMTAGKLEDFLPASVTYFPEYRFYLVRLPMKGGGTGLLALYRRCTHLGCVVPWLPGSTGSPRPPVSRQLQTNSAFPLQKSSPRSASTATAPRAQAASGLP